jgi:hypothetical protein
MVNSYSIKSYPKQLMTLFTAIDFFSVSLSVNSLSEVFDRKPQAIVSR